MPPLFPFINERNENSLGSSLSDLLVVTKLFAFEVCSGALHHYSQPVVDDYDKDLAVPSLRATDFAHAVPGVALAMEE
jgi:hypothetical protein